MKSYSKVVKSCLKVVKSCLNLQKSCSKLVSRWWWGWWGGTPPGAPAEGFTLLYKVAPPGWYPPGRPLCKKCMQLVATYRLQLVACESASHFLLHIKFFFINSSCT